MIGEMLGSYRVLSRLGEGGMGVVFVAEHPLLGRKAVVKLLHQELSNKPEIVQRFFNEARSASLIRHPAIVEVFDFGYHTSGSAFILMEFLEGEDLGKRLERTGVQDADFVIAVGRQIASALEAAHEQGIIHRDLKPDNVFLVPDREAAHGVRVKVLDFGIAKLAGEIAAGGVKTHTGAVMGTPAYMAPEQCKSAAAVDARADIYSLGCILFQMCCGRPPFLGRSLGEIIAAHMFEQPVAPRSMEPSVPADLEATILRSLAKEPDARQPSMEALAVELASCGGAAQEPALRAAGSGTRPVAEPAAASASAARPAAGRRYAATQVAAQGTPARIGAGTDVPQDQPDRALAVAATVPPAPATRGSRRRLVIAATAILGLGGAAVALTIALRHGRPAPPVGPPAPGPSEQAQPRPVPAASPSAAAQSSTTPAPAASVAPSATALQRTAHLVSHDIESSPSHAEVFRESNGSLVGQTPFHDRSPASRGQVVYIVRLTGYRDQRVELPADHDDTRHLTLVPVARAASGSRHLSKRKPLPKRPTSSTTSRHKDKTTEDGMLVPDLSP